MREIRMRYPLAALMVIALSGWFGISVPDAAAQKIVCWKDKSGKVIGCGDRVPPEYADSGVKELDKRGVTLKSTESADEMSRRKVQEQASTKKLEEERKRASEQQRQDMALMNTFTNEKEIDLKRDRELQAMDTQLAQARASHKIAVARLNEAKAGGSATAKDKKPSADALKDEVARAESDKTKAEQAIATKEKEIAEVRKRYAEMRERYILLKGGGAPGAPGASAAAPPPPAPAKAAPAKK